LQTASTGAVALALNRIRNANKCRKYFAASPGVHSRHFYCRPCVADDHLPVVGA
jgi:hypothetical protein